MALAGIAAAGGAASAAGGASSAGGMLAGVGGLMQGPTARALMGAGISHHFGQKSAAQAWDKWKDSLTRGPKYRMIGLRNAGLNPVLAAGNPSSPLAFNAMGATGPGSAPPLLDVAKQQRGTHERKLLDAQTATQRQVLNTGKAQEARERATIQNLEAQRLHTNSQTQANAGNVQKAKADSEYFGSQYLRDLENTQRALTTAGSVGFRMMSPTAWMGAAAAGAPSAGRFVNGKFQEMREEHREQRKNRKRPHKHFKGKQRLYNRR